MVEVREGEGLGVGHQQSVGDAADVDLGPVLRQGYPSISSSIVFTGLNVWPPSWVTMSRDWPSVRR